MSMGMVGFNTRSAHGGAQFPWGEPNVSCRDRKISGLPAAVRRVSPSSLAPTFQRLSSEKGRRSEIGGDINAAGPASHARPSALDPPPQPAAVAEGGTHTEQG
jgi:hypothetical protein